MAKIPVAQPQEINITRDVQVGEANVRKIPSGGVNTGDVLSSVGNTISDAGQMLEKAYSLAEKTKAQNILSTKLADIQARANADTDLSIEKRNKYHEEVDAAVRETSSYISLQQNKDLFLSDANGDSSVAKIKINNDFLKRTIDAGKADLIVRRDSFKNQYISASSDNEASNAILQDNQLIDDAVNSGYMTREEAAKTKIERQKDWTGALARRNIQNDPQGFLNEVNDKKGVYSNLDEEEKTKLIDDANNAIEKNLKIQEKIIKDKQDENYKTAMVSAFDGKLTTESVQELYKKDLISDTQFSKLKNYLYYNLPIVNEDDLSVYNEISQMQADGSKTPQEINNIILEKASENKLKNSSAKQLIGKTYTEFRNRRDDLIALNTKELRTVAEEFFRTSLDEPDKTKTEQAIYTFNRRVAEENAEGERIGQIAQEILVDSIRKEYPEINQVETINKVKEMFGVKDNQAQELPPPKKSTSEKSPFVDYPDAFKENGVWKVIKNGKKYRIEE